MGLQYTIKCKTGLINRAADALSHREHLDQGDLAAISVCKPVWLEAAKNRYQQDTAAQQRLAKLALDPESEPEFTMQEGILRYKSRVWIGNDKDIQQHLIQALHASAAGGHSGFHATYNRMSLCMAWDEGASENICAQLHGLSTG